MNITDNQLRGIVLKKYYERRRERRFQWNDSDFDDLDKNIEFDEVDLYRICDQLEEHGLINWKPIRLMGKTKGGLGEISAFGVDVVDKTENPPIAINFESVQITNVTNSSNVHIGDLEIQFNNIIDAINNFDAEDQQKEEAKSFLKQFLEHPIVAGIVGGLASNIQF